MSEGRNRLNFSTWGSGRQQVDGAAQLIRDGSMPGWDYLLLHPDARPTTSEQQQAIDGFAKTFGAGGG